MRAPRGSSSYFEFQLQTGSKKAAREVCYSPEKQAKKKESQEEKIPVQFVDVKFTEGRRRGAEEEYTIRKKSRVMPHKVDYQYDSELSRQCFTIEEVNQVSDYQSITIKAKILSRGQESDVNVRGNSLKKVDYMTTDHSGTVKMTVWERVVNLEIGKTYNVDNVSVRTLMM